MINYPHGDRRFKAVLVHMDLIPHLFSPHGPVSCLHGLPDGASFAGMRLHDPTGVYAFFFEHDDWEIIRSGDPVPEVVPVFSTTYENPTQYRDATTWIKRHDLHMDIHEDTVEHALEAVRERLYAALLKVPSSELEPQAPDMAEPQVTDAEYYLLHGHRRAGA